jgi:hypothetical protein
MKVGIVRADIGHIYLQDVENSSQRDFSSQPYGQSRYFHMPTDTEIQAQLNLYAFLTVQGTDMGATANTTVANGTKLNIKASAAAPFTQVVVTSGAAVTKTQIVSDLNGQFAFYGLPLVARISGTNQVTIDTTLGGANAYLSISAASPSAGTLQNVLGLGTPTLTPLAMATLKNAVYVGVTAIAGQTGAAASISNPNGVTATVTGLTGMTASAVGQALTISSSSTPGNNGTFWITQYLSSTSVVIANPDAATDSSGAVHWAQYTYVGVNVAPATINALSTFTYLSSTAQTNLDNAIANIIAPSLVETGQVLLSFFSGNLSKYISPNFQPGNTRSGLPAGVAAAIVHDDGMTPFTI